jgi:glycosyltransferase involved in cell wall biosynthesis
MTDTAAGRAAILVLPTTTTGQFGPAAGWISTSGWAAAAERELGRAWIVTPHGQLTVEEVSRRAAAREQDAGRRNGWRRRVPLLAKTIVKDVRAARRARRFRIDARGPWTDDGRPLAFVWQRHELFHTAGLDLADVLGVPSVLFVPAVTVWQAEQWSVRRPGWGPWLERLGETPALCRADLVACGTDVVADEVRRLGVREERILVTPTGADLDLFAAAPDRDVVRRELGLDKPFVIGWTGSFRPFHALEQLVRAAVAVPEVTLLLVGDGPERRAIQQLAADLGVPARFTGLVPHHEIPKLLAAMDVGVVLAQPGRPFHYSPLKVAEYLAAGLPVVAPSVDQLTSRLDEDGNAEFFPPGDEGALASVLARLGAEPERRRRLSAGARAAAPAWSWDEQVRRVCAALAAQPS